MPVSELNYKTMKRQKPEKSVIHLRKIKFKHPDPASTADFPHYQDADIHLMNAVDKAVSEGKTLVWDNKRGRFE